jgi:hypothetical protein
MGDNEQYEDYTGTYQVELPTSQFHRVKQVKESIQSNQMDDKSAHETVNDDSTEGDDMSPVDLLLQFIPFYGQGDPSNDSLVRSTLSSMSVEQIDSKDESGNTLLLLACYYRCEDLARIMLNKGANPLALNSTGNCSLHWACHKDSLSVAIAKVLLQNGADPEVRDFSGITPLHYAAESGELTLCKMLLSHGAQIGTVDNSNYTCVDYAKYQGHNTCADHLNAQLTAAKMQGVRSVGSMYGMGAMFGMPGGFGYGMGGGMGGGMGMMGGAPFSQQMMAPAFTMSEWAEYEDPGSQMKYYSNMRTGETLWENDFKTKMAAARPAPPPPSQQPGAPAGGMMSSQSAPTVGPGQGPGTGPGPGLGQGPGPGLGQGQGGPPTSERGSMGGIRHSFYAQYPALKAEADLELETFKLRVMAFFSKHAPTRMGETVDLLQNKYKGKEFDLLRDLCTQYGVPVDPEVSAYQITLKELQTEHLNKTGGAGRPGKLGEAGTSSAGAGLTITPVPGGPFATAVPPSPTAMGMAPMMGMHPGVDESMVQAMLSELRAKHDTQLEEERAGFRKALAEKDGALAGVQSELAGVRREKAAVVEAKSQLEDKVSRTQSQGGEALAKSEEEISRLHDANTMLKDELAKVRQELTYGNEKLQSLESSITNMASGHEETIAREKAAAEERAALMRVKEEQHAQEIKDLEGMMKANDMRAKYDLATAKVAWEKQEADLRATHDAATKAVEEEIEAVRRELTVLKARSAQELSAAQMEIEDLKRANEELLRRAESAEAGMRGMQAEVQEARAVQQYNTQLHKDLAREQLQRKRLHNEMEDMKGKIRVYVRIRPFSTNERSRGCTEAVTKDGKLSVLVKGANGPDSKKNYDFDNVFAGVESNTQADIFRDTKHLMLSVIDGYNVCIFAYGQVTGDLALAPRSLSPSPSRPKKSYFASLLLPFCLTASHSAPTVSHCISPCMSLYVST